MKAKMAKLDRASMLGWKQRRRCGEALFRKARPACLFDPSALADEVIEQRLFAGMNESAGGP
jgi:hypothetical protein